jgi:hypothetical protein
MIPLGWTCHECERFRAIREGRPVEEAEDAAAPESAEVQAVRAAVGASPDATDPAVWSVLPDWVRSMMGGMR